MLTVVNSVPSSHAGEIMAGECIRKSWRPAEIMAFAISLSFFDLDLIFHNSSAVSLSGSPTFSCLPCYCSNA